jgi:hypothetical protein
MPTMRMRGRLLEAGASAAESWKFPTRKAAANPPGRNSREIARVSGPK